MGPEVLTQAGNGEVDLAVACCFDEARRQESGPVVGDEVCGRQAGKDQADGQAVLKEVQDASGQLRDFIAVCRRDLVNSDDQA